VQLTAGAGLVIFRAKVVGLGWPLRQAAGRLTVIAAISLMRRRADISDQEFRKHWLDPHGVLTAGLPGVRYYVQHHCIESPATNALATKLNILGLPELWFDSYEARKVAYTSPRIAECNIDSEQFVGEVTRVVAEPQEIVKPPANGKFAKALLLAIGAPDTAWADATQARVSKLAGVVGYKRQNILEQAPAPNSKIPELKLRIAGLADVTFEDGAALLRHAGALAGQGGDADRVAIYAVEDYVLV
jgi:uncharacterized protein (TIGR02118 family)